MMKASEFVKAVNDVYTMRKFNAVCSFTVDTIDGFFEVKTKAVASNEQYNYETTHRTSPKHMDEMDNTHAEILAKVTIDNAKQVTFDKLFTVEVTDDAENRQQTNRS